MLLVLPQARGRLPVEENAISVCPLCYPGLREESVRRLSESIGMRGPIDQWADSSPEELEAFIESYFEMVREQTMGSFQAVSPQSRACCQEGWR